VSNTDGLGYCVGFDAENGNKLERSLYSNSRNFKNCYPYEMVD
jgi:hypothetical protein